MRSGESNAIQLAVAQHAALFGDLSNRLARPDRLFGNLGGRRVADVRAQRGGDGGAPIEQLARARRIGGDARPHI